MRQTLNKKNDRSTKSLTIDIKSLSFSNILRADFEIKKKTVIAGIIYALMKKIEALKFFYIQNILEVVLKKK